MFENNTCFTLSADPSPYPTAIAAPSQKIGAVLAVDEALRIVVMMMPEPSDAEIDNIAGRALSVALEKVDRLLNLALEGLAPSLIRLAARCDRKVEPRHRADLWRYFARTLDFLKAFDLAFIKGQAT